MSARYAATVSFASPTGIEKKRESANATASSASPATDVMWHRP